MNHHDPQIISGFTSHFGLESEHKTHERNFSAAMASDLVTFNVWLGEAFGKRKETSWLVEALLMARNKKGKLYEC